MPCYGPKRSIKLASILSQYEVTDITYGMSLSRNSKFPSFCYVTGYFFCRYTYFDEFDAFIRTSPLGSESRTIDNTTNFSIEDGSAISVWFYITNDEPSTVFDLQSSTGSSLFKVTTEVNI